MPSVRTRRRVVRDDDHCVALLRVESDGLEELRRPNGEHSGDCDGKIAGLTSALTGEDSVAFIGIDDPERWTSSLDWRRCSSRTTSHGSRRVGPTDFDESKIVDPIASSAAFGVVIVPSLSPVRHFVVIVSSRENILARSIGGCELEGQPLFFDKTPLGLEHSGGQNDFDGRDGSFLMCRFQGSLAGRRLLRPGRLRQGQVRPSRTLKLGLNTSRSGQLAWPKWQARPLAGSI